VRNLKNRMRRKAMLFPQENLISARWPACERCANLTTKITAKHCGFRDATDYYTQSSALRVAAEIRVRTLIVTAQDDPIRSIRQFFPIPRWRTMRTSASSRQRHGGHCAVHFTPRGVPSVYGQKHPVMEFFAGLSQHAPIPLTRLKQSPAIWIRRR